MNNTEFTVDDYLDCLIFNVKKTMIELPHLYYDEQLEALTGLDYMCLGMIDSFKKGEFVECMRKRQNEFKGNQKWKKKMKELYEMSKNYMVEEDGWK